MRRNEQGLSIVEILVSMVILSVVTMALTSVSVISAKGHKASRSSDDGYRFAREQLHILQDRSAPAATGSKAPFTHDGIEYTVSWTLSDSKPPLATVSVAWTQNGTAKTSEVAGYVDADNVCPEFGNGAGDPSDIKLENYDHTEITVFEICEATAAKEFIGIAVGVDPNGGDILNISLAEEGADNDNEMFSLSSTGDTVKTTEIAGAEGGSYRLELIVEDCAGGSYSETITYTITAISQKPQVYTNQTPLIAINEGVSGQSDIGQLSKAPDSNPNAITWINCSDGRLNVHPQSGEVTVKNAMLFNFESEPTVSFTITARKNNNDSTIIASFDLIDINEVPSSISTLPTSLTIPADADTTTEVGIAIAHDPDSQSTNTAWKTLTYYESGNSDAFRIVPNTGEIKVKPGVTFQEGVTRTISLYAKDDGGEESAVYEITINITAPENIVAPEGCGTLWHQDGWITAPVYTAGVLVEDNSKLWKAIPNGQYNRQPAGLYGSAGWEEVGVCP